jgi:FlaA1/EpsC-like NDP-sugar epimerase
VKTLMSKLFSRSVAFVHDLLMVPVAWLGAYWLRFNLQDIPEPMLDYALWDLLLIVPVQVVVFRLFGLYRGVWRFASLPDLARIVKAVMVGLALSMATVFVVTRLEGVPRSVPVLYGLLLALFLSTPRLVYRWLKDHRFHLASGKRVLIVGAGQAGEMLLRDFLRGNAPGYQPIAFVDDDRRKWGREIHGVRVLSGTDTIPRLVTELEIEVIVLAVPSAGGEQLRRLVGVVEQSGVPFRTVPRLEALMSGQVSINQLRPLSIEDLLGRKPVSLDWPGIEAGLRDKTILVTGAGGSIGSELCRQIARLKPAALILFESSEFNLYSVEQELCRRFPALPLKAHLCDVRDEPAVLRVFQMYRPQLVFHAAAYKQVPMLESQVREAVWNNVAGTLTVAKAADRYECSEFVLISTDKAVNPANVMGVTKRVAEIYCQNFNRHSSTRFITVRFGNVLGSAGSVVPLFHRQIAEGGPVTVTHPEIVRYFMTIPEACQLIMQAGVLGGGGEIFVLDMDQPVRIRYLAEQMIRLSGKIPGQDIEIIYTGLRPGEKLTEELFHPREHLARTQNEKILLARYRPVGWGRLNDEIDRLCASCRVYDGDGIMASLRWFVPEYLAEAGAPKDAVGSN